ncbi:MAG: hypothetical protein ACYC33_09475 [Thermoleophilia bacterium]
MLSRGAEELAAERAALEFDRTLAAFEGGRIVGTTAVLSLDFTTLARARRVHESIKGAAARADDLFRTERAPWCSTHF